MPAQARRIQIDFDGTSFATTGEIFPLADATFGTGSAEVPFFMNLGGGSLLYDFCMNPNGFVAFVPSGDACSASDTPTGNYIAPFAAALTVGGNTSFSIGLADVVHAGTAADPFVEADATPAIRFVWEGTDSASNQILVGLMLFDKGGGDFDFEFRYGNDLNGINGAPATGSQSFVLGANTFGPVPGPFATETTYSHSVVGGVCTTGCGEPPTEVPEPPMLQLLALGLALAAIFGYHTRRRSPATKR